MTVRGTKNPLRSLSFAFFAASFALSSCSVDIRSARERNHNSSSTNSSGSLTAAAALSWIEVPTSNSLTVNAVWTKSSSAGLVSQKIEVFSDALCSTSTGAPVNLASSVQTYSFFAPSDGIYSYKITSTDTSANSTISVCSSTITIDQSPPAPSSAVGWTQASPYNALAVQAAWTKSPSADLANQKLQFYSDGVCGTTWGSLVNLGSSSQETYAITTPGAGNYTYRVTSVDNAGNTVSSPCSSVMTIDLTAPAAATALSWLESSPSNSLSVTASWTKSTSGDLANQKIQFYSDSFCGTASGSLITLGSASTQTRGFTAPSAGAYTYILSSVDAANNITASACSSPMVIDTSPPAAATALSWVESSPHNSTNVTASWTKSASGDLANQSIQFYSDSTCGTPSGSSVVLGSSSTQTYGFVAPSAGTYTYKITSIDTAANSTTSNCSSAMVIDTTAPNNATALGWSQSSPYNNLNVTAAWTKSSSGDLSNQKIQFYADGTCTATSGTLIDLASSSLQTRAFTAPSAGTYTYKITSIDTATNSTTSSCSSAMVIDTTAPNAATSLSWSQSSPYNSLSVTASWTKSSSGDLSNQKIQFYADGTCTATSGSLIDLSSSTAQTSAFTAPSAGTYTYKITSIDTATNSITSSCSSAMVIDTTAPSAATALAWVETSPNGNTSITATWTKSASADLGNQKIQFYADGTCTSTSGLLIDLTSSTAQTYAWGAPGSGTYSYKVTSIDTAANSIASSCSSVMTVTTTAPNNATALAWTQTSPYNNLNVTASWTKSTSVDLGNQKIQFYADSTCTTTSGVLIDLASTVTQTYAFTAPAAGTYSYKITSVNTALNTSVSTCSSAMVIDTTAPNASTSLSWSQTSPYNSLSVTAAWTKSSSGDLANQKIQFYADGTCTATSGSLIDLASASAQTNSFTAPSAGTYTYKITSIDTAANSITSSCSSAMVIDTTAPSAATALGWSQTSPYNILSVTAAWTKSAAGDLGNQKIQYYADGTCTATSGPLIDLASSNAQTNSFTAPSAGTYTYKITSIDTAANSTTSNCSSAMVIDTTAPNNATALGWSQSTPYNNLNVTAAWTKSSSGDLANQKIQFYADGTCTATSGSLIDLASSSLQTRAFTAPSAGTYTYKITSIDTATNSTTSSCSSAMVIDTTAPNAATSLSWSQSSPYNSLSVTAAWTKSSSGDLANQKIQYYADGTCTATSGSLIDLSSSTAQTSAFTAPSAGTYTYKITSIDTATNSITSSCSSAMVIDTTPPNNATTLGWTQSTPYNSVSVTASWTKSNSGDLSNQKIQYYSDSTCTTTSGSLIDLASSATQTNAFSAPGAGTYTYKITSVDSAANATTSNCSSAMVIDLTAPNNALTLTWSQTSPYNSLSVTASWAKSNSSDLANQKIQFYADGTCTSTSGSLIDLSSSSVQTSAFTAPSAGTYTYKITSIDTAANSSTSACSGSMVIDLTPPAAATGLGWAESTPRSANNATATWIKSASGDLANQKIRFYSDASCTTNVSTLLDLASNTLQTYNENTSVDGAYYFILTSIDTAGNSTASTCSPLMTIDQTAPNAATSIGWSQSSPSSSLSVTAAWTKSSSGDLANQKLQVYIDGTCSSAPSLINLSSSTAQTYVIPFEASGTYSYKLVSYDAAGNSTASACSSTMVIDTTPGTFAITSAVAKNQKVTLSWGAASNAVSYTVKYGTSSGTYGTVFSTSATSPIDVTGLTNNTTYYFMVTAVNTGMTRNATAEFFATPNLVLATTAGPSTLSTGICSSSAYTITARDASGAAYNVPSALTVNLTASTGTTFYSSADTTCTGSAITSISIGTGTSTQSFYAKTNIAQSLSVEGTSSGYVTSPLSVTSSWNPTRIDTVAGVGMGMGSTDGNGTAARLHGPMAVALDTTNNLLYVADTKNCTIRKVDLNSSNATTTIAGTAGSCSITNGSGSAARFENIMGLTYDGARYLYALELTSCKVRKVDTQSPYPVTTVVDSTCSTSTLGDGTSTGSSFGTPQAIHYAGNMLYISDKKNVIRRVDLSLATTSTSYIITMAGTYNTSGSTNANGTAAKFKTPAGLTSDATYLYVADTGNDSIRKVTIASPYTVSDVITGAAYSGFGLTMSGTNLYLLGGNKIAKVTTAGVISGLAGNTSSTSERDADRDGTGTSATTGPVFFFGNFIYSLGLATDGTYIYIPDANAHNIKRVVISTKATTAIVGSANKSAYANGSGSNARFMQINAIATDGTSVYLGEGAVGNMIRKYDIATGAVTTLSGTSNTPGCADGPGASATFTRIGSMAYRSGFLFIYDDGCSSGVIRTVNTSTGMTNTISATSNFSGGSSANLAISGTTLFAGTSTNSYTVLSIDVTNGSYPVVNVAGTGTKGDGAAGGNAATTNIGTVTSIWADASKIYFYDSAYYRIRAVDYASTNTLFNFLGNGSFAQNPVDGTGTAGTLSGSYVNNGTTGDSNYLYHLDMEGASLRKISLTTGASTVMVGPASGSDFTTSRFMATETDGTFSSTSLTEKTQGIVYTPHGIFITTRFGLRWIH